MVNSAIKMVILAKRNVSLNILPFRAQIEHLKWHFQLFYFLDEPNPIENSQ